MPCINGPGAKVVKDKGGEDFLFICNRTKKGEDRVNSVTIKL
jgi:hypothetical protein